MPFAVFFDAAPKPRLPEERGPRLRELHRIYNKLQADYGAQYPEMNEALRVCRDWVEDDPRPEVTDVVQQVQRMRTDVVLYYKNLIVRTEFLINELEPGSFPVEEDAPLQSVDADEVFQLGASLVAAGAIIGGVSGWTGGGAIAAGIVGGVGATMMAGAAIYGMIYD